MINALFEHFVEASPLTVMMRALMERIFAADKLDALFEQVADRQYTRTLLFSSVVGLMGLVVSGIHPSVSAAYKALEKVIGVSRPALYGKLNGLEPGISQALVRYSDAELRPLIEALNGTTAAPSVSYPIRIADGNLLGPTDHRLAVLRSKRAGALPGKSIAVLDPRLTWSAMCFFAKMPMLRSGHCYPPSWRLWQQIKSGLRTATFVPLTSCVASPNARATL